MNKKICIECPEEESRNVRDALHEIGCCDLVSRRLRLGTVIINARTNRIGALKATKKFMWNKAITVYT